MERLLLTQIMAQASVMPLTGPLERLIPQPAL